MRKMITAAAVLLLAAGCSSSGSKPAAAPSASTTTAGQPPPAAQAASTSAAAQLGVGSTATVKTAGGSLEVTLIKVADPAAPKASSLRLTDGGRWAAVQLRFTNKGPTAATGPLYGLSGVDAQGQQIKVQLDAVLAAGPSIDVLSGLNLAPGESALGFVTFPLPKDAKLVHVKFAPPGGSMAEWDLT